jgi:hypothetical protein
MGAGRRRSENVVSGQDVARALTAGCPAEAAAYSSSVEISLLV